MTLLRFPKKKGGEKTDKQTEGLEKTEAIEERREKIREERVTIKEEALG